MNKCQLCDVITNNPKFCSRSCSVTYNNKENPKRKKQGKCRTCDKVIASSRLYCSKKCHPPRRRNPSALMGYPRLKEYRRKAKIKAVNYKGGKCEKCGYSKCLSALEFHHLDPKEKDFSISRIITRVWSAIQTELDKCIMVCANCHREVHEGLVN